MKKLNKKTPLWMCFAALLLCATLLTVLLSSQSLAKYISKKNVENVAGVATLNCGIGYSKTEYQNISINVNVPCVYMVVDEFVFENTGEVAFAYELWLQLSAKTGREEYGSPVAVPHGSLAAPARADGVAFRQIRMKNASTAEIVDVNFSSVCAGQTYVQGKLYYAVSTDNRNFTWHTVDDLAMTGELIPNGKIYYKVAYFIDLSAKDETFAMPETTLLYRAECEQILK